MKKRLLMSALLLLQGCGGGSGGSGETPPGNQPDPVAGANQPPQISELSLNDANGGEVLSGDTLVLSYRYQDAEGDPEGDSDIRWYRDDQPFTPQDAYQYTVAAADRGHRIGVSVALVAKSGNTTPLAPQLTEVSVPPLQASELSWQLDQSSYAGVVGEELINPVTTTSRPVQYQSSDPVAAFVNPDGKVRMQQAGRVTISASVAETNQYHAASASYELVIRDNEFVLSGWVGEHATEMNIGAQTQDLNLAVSRGTGCANMVVYGCPGYRVHPMPVGTTQATTETITLDQGGVIQVETDSAMGRGVIDNFTFDYFDTLEYPAVVEFNDKMWLIGGYSQGQISDRIYSSVDGRAWKREYAENGQALPAYYKANVVEFNNELWLIGGVNAQNQYDARIWKSADGVHWQSFENEAQTGILKNASLVNSNDRLWLVGYNDDKEMVLWSSVDGINWLKAGNLPAHQKYYWRGHMVSLPAADNQPARLLYHHPETGIYVRRATSDGSWQKLSDTEMGSATSFVVHGSEILLVDPQAQILKRTTMNDLSQWQTLESDHGYPAQANAVVIYAKQQLWLVAGKADTDSFEPQQGWIYSSPDDGKHWINRSESRTLPSTNQAGLFSRNGTLHLMNRGDTLVSQDGLFWSVQEDVQNSQLVTARSVVMFKGQQYALSGSSNVLRLADNAWQQIVSLSNNYARLVVHNDRLLVIGNTAIYASTDGTSWTYWSASPLLNRTDYEVVSYDGNIIVLMGQFSNTTNFFGKVYTSVDGKDWVQHAATGTGITGRFSFSVTKHNDYLWMIGGARNEPGVYSTKNGVWRSSNGYQWELVTSGIEFSQRHGASLVSHNGQLMFLGGLGNGGYQNSIWRSADGKNWQRGFYKNLALMPLQ